MTSKKRLEEIRKQKEKVLVESVFNEMVELEDKSTPRPKQKMTFLSNGNIVEITEGNKKFRMASDKFVDFANNQHNQLIEKFP